MYISDAELGYKCVLGCIGEGSTIKAKNRQGNVTISNVYSTSNSDIAKFGNSWLGKHGPTIQPY